MGIGCAGALSTRLGEIRYHADALLEILDRQDGDAACRTAAVVVQAMRVGVAAVECALAHGQHVTVDRFDVMFRAVPTSRDLTEVCVALAGARAERPPAIRAVGVHAGEIVLRMAQLSTPVGADELDERLAAIAAGLCTPACASSGAVRAAANTVKRLQLELPRRYRAGPGAAGVTDLALALEYIVLSPHDRGLASHPGLEPVCREIVRLTNLLRAVVALRTTRRPLH
jgi:hypothetical protein